MQTLIDDKRDNHWQNKLKMTKHFIERYHERVWHTTPPADFYWKKMIETILLDIDERLLDREKTLLEMFIDSNHLELPFDRHYLLIIINKKLVTVLRRFKPL
jgi:hypothetical protein